MNKLICGLCQYYDPILGPNEKYLQKGWCAKRSLYPAQEGPGQIFPTGVKRVERGKLAEPYIVKHQTLVVGCADARSANTDQIAAKRTLQISKDKTGRRVLS